MPVPENELDSHVGHQNWASNETSDATPVDGPPRLPRDTPADARHQ